MPALIGGECMRVPVYASALVLAWSGAVLMAQAQKVTTPEQLDKVMRQVQPAMQATNKALASGAYAEVRKNLATVKENVLLSQSFWIEHKKDDGAACRACHQQYRATDAENNYILKPGSIGG